MTKHLLGCYLTGLLMFASGCAICASPFDSHYAAYGGAWDRVDPSQGRVASVFQPASSTVESMSVPETTVGMPTEDGQFESTGDRSILAPQQPDSAVPNDDRPPDLDSLLQQ